MLTGIASVIYPSNNLDEDKAFWSSALGTAPYFDQPFYVGFNIDGRELGLDPTQLVKDCSASTDCTATAFGVAAHAAGEVSSPGTSRERVGIEEITWARA